jgi:hypothetical protein
MQEAAELVLFFQAGTSDGRGYRNMHKIPGGSKWDLPAGHWNAESYLNASANPRTGGASLSKAFPFFRLFGIGVPDASRGCGVGVCRSAIGHRHRAEPTTGLARKNYPTAR